jgi:adhesin/invasin
MNSRKRRVLALAVLAATFICLQCAEKEGPVTPILETDPPQYTITISASPARIEPGEQSDIVAAVEDSEGKPPEEEYDLDFSVDFGSVTGSATINEEGVATVKYTAPGSTGMANITASGEDAIPKTTSIQVGEGALLAPFSMLADGMTQVEIGLEITDSDGEPVTGVIVTFSTDRGMVYPTTVATGADGVAKTTLTSVASVEDVLSMLSAEATVDDMEISETASVWMRGVTVMVDASPDEIPADGTSTSIVVVRVSETTLGYPVAKAEVAFSTTLGAIGASTITDADGYGSVNLLSGSVAGVAEITANYGFLSDATSVTFGELNLSLFATLPRMVADGISQQWVIATLLTEDNNPVTGVDVEFSTTQGIITGSVRTDCGGMAGALLTSTSYAATAQVTASFTDEEASATVEFENPVVTLKASPVTITALPSNTSQITAYVSFSDGSPVPDGTPAFFSTTEGAIGSPGQTESGMATTDLRPTGVASSEVTVRAQVGNSVTSTDLMFTADDPAVVFAEAMPATVPGDGSSFSTIIAEVTDLFGNPVEDGTVIDFYVTSGQGIVTPSALTASGIATAQFVATGGGGIATVTVGCKDFCSVSGNVAIAIESGVAGAIVADPDAAWIAVAGTNDDSQVTVFARVYDSARNPVADGTEVIFEIETGPGGGEYLDSPASGYGPVTRQTSGGAASITVNSGTEPGTMLMLISSTGAPSTGCKIGISAGDPDSLILSLGEVATNGDGTYTLAVSAIVRDEYNNPVENGTAVYFTLDRSDIGFINPETQTGDGYPCNELEGDPIKGVTRACLTYPTESIFETVTITASTGGGDVTGSLTNGLPIVDGSVSLEAYPASVSGAAGGTVTIYVTVWDHYGLIPVDKAGVGFGIEGAGTVDPPTAVTDETGVAMTTLTIPAGSEEGVTKIKAWVWMSDIEGDIDITITP